MLRKLSSSKGFTLIEVMMVVLIFSIMISFVAINTHFLYTDIKQSENVAANLKLKLKMARQLAVMQQAMLRFVISDNEMGFQKLTYTQNGYQWNWLPNKSSLKKETIKRGLNIQINQTVQFYPNGRFSPFTITIHTTKENPSIIVFGNSNNEIGVSRSEK